MKREVVMKCVHCRRYSSNSPMSEPVSLPVDRVKDANVFDITGIDLAGPLFTRDGGKVWIVLYTFAIYRAIHLELVSSLSTECFMLSLRRFIARRTRPETIYTDNGTNFVGTNGELKNLDWDKIMQETDNKPIKWKFNPPNCRLVGRSRFRKEYLGQLRQKRPGKPAHDFKVGDVMIEEPSKKRVYWPLGKVISLLPGRDGNVRTLKLKCKNSELIRPIHRVYPLEVPFINNEIVKIDGVPTSSVNEDKLTSNAVIKNKVTRSEKLTVWCALWAGGIIGPYFFKNDEGHNVTVNGDRYRAMITNFFIPELNNHDVQEPWFQQDGATCHTARATIDLLKDTFGDRLISRFGSVNWPPRSCDLTPLDYFL
ncbi:uncharacterized protein TNCV_3888321 [Trichonephila clavipes]|nr:uncharacterized protein TNCV_3888321 [Trichonephila clavipes]